LAYIYNDQSAGDRALSSKINALSVATGRKIDDGLYPEQAARYVVFVEGGLYHYRDCHTGAVSTGNANAATVIHAARDLLTAGRTWKETIVLKGDFYTIETLLFGSYTRIVLDGMITATATMAAMIRTVPNTQFFEFTGGTLWGNKTFISCGYGIYVPHYTDYLEVDDYADPSNYFHDVIVADFTKGVVEGSRKTSYQRVIITNCTEGFWFISDATDSIVTDVYVKACQGNGFHVEGKWIRFKDCISDHNTGVGVLMKGWGNSWDGGYIEYAGGNGVTFAQWFFDNSVRNTHILENTGYGVHIDGGFSLYVSQNNFLGNAYAIYEEGVSYNNTIINNQVDENDDTCVFVALASSGDVIHGNIGFLMESKGISTGTAAQQTIAHGLAGIPTYVFFSNIENGANPYQSAAADITNIYVTAGNGLDYAWNAIHEP